ncbi:MAG: Smr/MutS family protein [Legionellaceae bacterium]|nr:Smr/MutS family protein [Legionellaceae bacterium]
MLYCTELQFDNLYSTIMPKKTDVSEDEKNLFREMMRDVTPLKKQPKAITKKSPIQPVVQKKVYYPPIKKSPRHHLSSYYHKEVQPNCIISYSRDSISKKRLTEIKNAKSRYEAKIDLHGLNPDDASDILVDFIEKQYSLGRRIVLVIHGKGGIRGEAPILKNLVNQWLPQLPHVLLFHSAKPKDGGNGAVYVLLKANKNIEL